MFRQERMIIVGLVIGMLLVAGMLIITSMLQDNNNLYALLLLLWILITIAFGFIYMATQGISISINPPIRFI